MANQNCLDKAANSDKSQLLSEKPYFTDAKITNSFKKLLTILLNY